MRRLTKVSSVKIREYGDTPEGDVLFSSNEASGKPAKTPRTLTLVELLQPSIPSSMRLRQVQAYYKGRRNASHIS